jgi:hypothetical protein
MRQVGMVAVALVVVLMGVGAGLAAGPTLGGVGTPVTAPGGTYRQIGPTTLKAMLAQKDFTFVNVHVPYEREIAETDAHVPYDLVASRSRDCPRSGTRRLCCIAGPDT